MSDILLGFNCNCFTNRYDEPWIWPKLCHDMGIRHVMFNIDLIDPWWPWELQKRLCDKTLDECAKYGISIFSSFGGHHGHQHYLGHFDEQVRQQSEMFFQRAIRQAAYLGGRSFGTCFAILTAGCNDDAAMREEIINDAVDRYGRLAEYAAKVGLPSLSYEMTSVVRETCATFAENDEILERCVNMAVPMRICLDLGHKNVAGFPEEADPLCWIRRYGKRSDVIDCQQSDLSASHHWPFTPSHNIKGMIYPEDVVNAIEDSGAGEILLAFEIKTPAYYPADDNHLCDLKASVDYWRQWVKK